MSYCVHCGVRLDDSIKSCPLCGTPVQDPAAGPGRSAPYFSPRQVPMEPVSHRELGLLISLMLASASLCCVILNLLVSRHVPWCLFVVGAAVMLWLWFVPPLLRPAIPLWVRGMVAVAAVALYVRLIAVALDGRSWFYGIALPICAAAALVWLLLCITGTVMGRRSTLSTICLLLGGLAAFLLAVEAVVDLYLHEAWQPGWSLITLTVLVGFIVPLVVVRRVPSLREETRRRFHF